MKKVILIVTITGILAYAIDLAIGSVWTHFVLDDMTFHRYWGFIDTLHLFDWVPTILLYTLTGYLFTYYMKLSKANLIYILAVFILVLELFMVRIHFSNESDIVNKMWAYFSYIVPSISAISGYLAYLWLTKRPSGRDTRHLA